MPDSLIYLDLALNNPNSRKSIDERIVTIYPLLKPSIQYALSTHLDKTKFIMQKMDYMIFGNRTSYKDMKRFPFAISESRLEKLVHILEKRKDCSTFFMAGLLLEGKIPSQIKRDFSASELSAYWEKRMHDAISLYMKAGSFMDSFFSDMLAVNILIAKRTVSVIMPGFSTPIANIHDDDCSSDSNYSYCS